MQTHGDSQGLGVVDLDIEGKGRLEARCEQLDAVCFSEGARAREKRLEPILEFHHGAGVLAHRQLAQGVGAEWQTEPEVEALGEAAPWRSALIMLNLHIRQLCAIQQVIGGHPNLLFSNALLEEVRLAAVDEGQQIAGAIVLGEVHLL
jgi:hypothetical protein